MELFYDCRGKGSTRELTLSFKKPIGLKNIYLPLMTRLNSSSMHVQFNHIYGQILTKIKIALFMHRCFNVLQLGHDALNGILRL